MLSLGLPLWQIIHGLCIITDALLVISGFVGFVLTGMQLGANEHLVALAWATGGVGSISFSVDLVFASLLRTLNLSNPAHSHTANYINKKLTILGGSALNIGFIMVLLLGISVADGIAAGTKHTIVHPGVTKLMASLCMIAKVLAILIDVRLLMEESRLFRRFDMLVQDEEELGFQDEPFEPLASVAEEPGFQDEPSGTRAGVAAEGSGRDEVDLVDLNEMPKAIHLKERMSF